jgi:lysine 6-dehydrogenase
MNKTIAVLGSGLVGSYIARQLNQLNFQVVSYDVKESALQKLKLQSPDIDCQITDVSNPESLSKAIQDVDLVIGAVPGFLGYQVLETVIQNQKSVVDISFMPEDPSSLNELAHINNVTAVVDMGLSPGLHNLFIGYACARKQFESGLIYVGGLPKIRKKPYEYQLVFSARDVIEEYTRPARYLENKKSVTQPALSDVETIEFPDIGTLEAFNSDGLRTLLHTSPIPTLKEKTLRYPGHTAQMWSLREAGFFSERKVIVKGQSVSPVDVTCEVLKQAWAPQGPGHDIALLNVKLIGPQGNAELTIKDFFSEDENATAMARTTGLPCIAMATALLENPTVLPPGVHPPENFGGNEVLFHRVMRLLADHKVPATFEV